MQQDGHEDYLRCTTLKNKDRLKTGLSIISTLTAFKKAHITPEM